MIAIDPSLDNPENLHKIEQIKRVVDSSITISRIVRPTGMRREVTV
jgi:hypothetical protein